MSKIFKRPEIKNVDFCVDENIRGPPLYDEQLPQLKVLELLRALGSNHLNRRKLGPKARISLQPGDTITIRTPGGGGYGSP